MQLIPEKLLHDAPTTYPAPVISSKRARDYQEDESEDDSYGSLLTTGTDVSVLTNDDMSLNNPPIDFQQGTYAEVVRGTSITVEETPTSSPSASAYAEWNTEKQTLMNQINHQAHMIETQAQQIDKIQADLESKISRSKDLEDQLAQALETAQLRELKFDEMMEKFNIMMEFQKAHRKTNQLIDDEMQELPSTPDQLAITEGEPLERPKVGPSPPSKRQNSNSSPHRNIYALFGQPSGKPTKNPPSNHREISKTLYPSDATTMDTDDDGHQPASEAQSDAKMTS
jgi:hypothetical protein